MKRRAFLHSSLAAAAAAALSPHYVVFGALPASPGDVAAVRGDGSAVTLSGAALRELQAALRGRLLLASTEGYDTARHVLNPTIDRHPALIVQPTGAEDVRQAVTFAREYALLTAVKCGGHSFSGQSTCDGGMMIDLSAMRGARVDPAARRVWVAGGSLLGLVDHETAPYGLVTPLGTVSHTGVGGLTTGGGFGRLARRYGLALDNVTALEVVAADGRLYRASEEENPDLYWGVRGAGGNFGVVTGFEFALHPMQREVVAGRLLFPGNRARDLLTFLDDYGPQAPDALQIDFFMLNPPGGDTVAMLHLCYSGPAADAERALAPMRKLGTPLDDNVKAESYVTVQRASDQADPRALGSYMKTGFVDGFPAGLVDAVLQGFEGDPARVTVLFTQQSGGAINRVAPEATAFAHRDVEHNLMVNTGWRMDTDGAPHMAWAREYWNTLEPFTSGFYANDINEEGAEAVDANYRQNYRRLVALKDRYDPTNLFRLNANVRPSRKGTEVIKSS